MLNSLEPLINLAKRRGFFFQTADLYGGASGLFDLGPLGVELNRAIKEAWWKRFVQMRDDIVGLDGSILTPAPVLKASGHVDSFSDPLIECANCNIRLRADHFMEEDSVKVWMERWIDEATKIRKNTSKKDEAAAVEAAQYVFDFSDPDHVTPRPGVSHTSITCPNPECRKREFGEPRQFNMMFKTFLGPIENEGATAYLRPETAQSIFINYKNIVDTSRVKVPFGIAQIGKAFRNEITIGNSLFRTRELEQMEIEYFVRPGQDEAIHETWIAEWEAFTYDDLGIKKEHCRLYEHPKEKLSHYSKRTVDIEYQYPFGGYSELAGIANRTDFDLKSHQEHSGRDLTYFEEETRERFIPYVIEPTFGVGRAMLAVLADAYEEFPQGRAGDSSEPEVVLHLKKELAPVRVAILPLMKKDGLAEKAREVHTMLKSLYRTQYDDGGAVGRRYRRQDEIGTPYCVTVDYQTLEDGTVTVRDRDTMEQVRVAIADLAAHVA